MIPWIITHPFNDEEKCHVNCHVEFYNLLANGCSCCRIFFCSLFSALTNRNNFFRHFVVEQMGNSHRRLNANNARVCAIKIYSNEHTHNKQPHIKLIKDEKMSLFGCFKTDWHIEVTTFQQNAHLHTLILTMPIELSNLIRKNRIFGYMWRARINISFMHELCTILANMLDDHQFNHKKRPCSFFISQRLVYASNSFSTYILQVFGCRHLNRPHYLEVMHFLNTSSITLTEKLLVSTHIQGGSNNMLAIVKSTVNLFFFKANFVNWRHFYTACIGHWVSLGNS